MNEINIDVALGFLSDKLHELSNKHFVMKQELSRSEQELLLDLHHVALHAVHKEIIRKHFSTKK